MITYTWVTRNYVGTASCFDDDELNKQ